MQHSTLLNVVVRESFSILKLLAGKDQPLLIWMDAFYLMNLVLDRLNSVGGVDVKRDRFARECLNRYLRASLVTPNLYDLLVLVYQLLISYHRCRDI